MNSGYYYLLVFFVIYTICIFLVNRRTTYRLSEKYSKPWRRIHYISFVLVLIAIMLNTQFHLDFRGLWTSRIFWLAFLATGIFYAPICAIPNRKLTGFYFKLFSFVPTLTGLFTLIPFLGIVIFLAATEQLFVPAYTIYYEDNTIRIESRSKGPLGPAYTDIVEKKGLFEKTISSTPMALQKSAAVRYSPDSIYIHFTADSAYERYMKDYNFKR